MGTVNLNKMDMHCAIFWLQEMEWVIGSGEKEKNQNSRGEK